MIFWQGLGFLALLIPFAVFFLVEIVFGKEVLNAPYVTSCLAIFCGAVLWYIGNNLKNKEGRVLFDPKTGEKVIDKPKHTLFWIPLHIVGVIFIVFAFILQLPKVLGIQP